MVNRAAVVILTALSAAMPSLHAAARAVAPGTRQAVEDDWQRQEKVSWARTVDSPKALAEVLGRGRLMVADFRAMGADDVAGVAGAQLDAIAAEAARGGADRRQLYLRARWAVRRLALANPRLDFDEVLFVRRHHPKWGHQCSHRVGEAQIPGADLCVLGSLSPSGKVRSVLGKQLPLGGIGRPDLSFDGRRVVFPYAAPRAKPTPYGHGKPNQRGGSCVMYDIYEIAADGSGLRRLTHREDSEDTEPCYLPDGRIAFTSSRDGRYVQCGDWALVCALYSMAPDGSEVRLVTQAKEGEFYPSVLDDGRIVYTRWDYVMKPFNVIQQLWAVSPDGARAQLVYGDHYAFSKGPIAFFEARQIPGASKVICTGNAHHNTGGGPIMILDLACNRGGSEGMVRVTPEVGYPEAGMNNRSSPTGWYSSPYPLTQRQFLVTYSFEAKDTVANAFGLYLADVHGNRELVYRDKDFSCYAPIPLRPRKRPAVISAAEPTGPDETGTLIVTDVYRGLPSVERGTVKYLRVLETHSKKIRTTPQRCDIGVASGWDVRSVLGTVPVEADGSAHFRVPSGRQIFFEALDEDYLEVRRMRNFMNVQPGEVTGCVGCHEPAGTVPSGPQDSSLTALQREASEITPPPWGAEGFSFKGIVQPVLTRHCIRCHDGSGAEGKAFDLRGQKMLTAPGGAGSRDAGPQHSVSDSFLNLLKHVSYVRVGAYEGDKLPLPPYATGSHESRLMQIHKAGHNGVKLSRAEWRAMAAWIDCNAPFYGDWADIEFSKAKAPAKPGKRTPQPVLAALRKPTAADRAHVDARCKQIRSELAEAAELAAYMNCGIELKSGQAGPVTIRQVRGRGWSYTREAIAGLTDAQRDITFDATQIVFEIAGLKADRLYQVGLVWWDFNAAGRKQSIWAAPADGKSETKLLDTTLLPQYGRKGGQLPQQVLLDLPPHLTQPGRLNLLIRNEAGANAVIGELWITSTPAPPGPTP